MRAFFIHRKEKLMFSLAVHDVYSVMNYATISN